MPTSNAPFEAVAEGLRVALKVAPKAARAGITGVEADAAGRALLRVRVTEAPEGGKANAAVVKLLAKAWKLPKGTLRVTAGAKDRRKTLVVTGDPVNLQRTLTAWLDGLGVDTGS